MTPLSLVAFGGMVVMTGLVLVGAQLRPAAPKLASVISQLNAMPLATADAARSVEVAGRWRWLPAPLAEFVEAHVGVSDADLEILSMSRSQLAARKIGRAGIGLLMPSVFTALVSLGGNPPPLIFPGAFALILAAALWASPTNEAKQKAARARAEFRAALRAFLTLVAQERAARGSPTEALEEASRGWHGWPYQLIHTEVLRSELSGQPPWTALRELGSRLGVEELRSMAEIVATAAGGAAVFDTLLAEARSLHHAELSAQQGEANAASERLIQPLGLLAFGFVLMILIPPLLRLFNA
jgi:hypothetical protein